MQCVATNNVLLVSSILLMVIIGVKFFAALQFESDHSPEPQDKYTICCVPCYNEGAESLNTCIHSIADSIYAEQRLLLFIIVDGVVKGAGNDRPTNEIVLEILGSQSENPPLRMYQSLGEGSLQLNFAQVYSGVFAHQSQSLPYILVVKKGDQKEKQRPGNRGKRDSQMILMQFLSRVYTKEAMSPLELELYVHFSYMINVDPKSYEVQTINKVRALG
jgi:chitin synthase